MIVQKHDFYEKELSESLDERYLCIMGKIKNDLLHYGQIQ